MGGVFVKDGIGFATNNKAAFYTEQPDGKEISVTKDLSTLMISSPWAPWGDDNLEPIWLKDDIENCGVLSAGVEAEARLAVGKGIDPYLLVDKAQDGSETLEWVSDSQVNDWLEENENFLYSYQNIYNQIGYGWGATQFILNQNGDYINRIAATDVHTARIDKKDKDGYINNMYLSSDWRITPLEYDPSKMKKIPLLQPGYELKDLQAAGSGYEFGILNRLLKNGRQYYPPPPHRSAKAWVKLSRSIPAIKDAMNKNQMSIKYLIIIADSYWQRINPKWNTLKPDERAATIQKKYDEINEFLTGERNAGKTILAGKYLDPVTKLMVDDISIQVLDDKMKDGRMLPDGAAADKQILFSMFFNPAIWGGNLLGDGASGGAGSGSDIREATLVLLMLLHPERMQNLTVFNLVKKFNGWSKRLEVERTIFPVTGAAIPNGSSRKMTPRLVFRYSSSILTTLDTGKSQKPITN